MPIRKVNTATLIRGQLYSLRHPDNTPQDPKESLRFEYGKSKVIEEPHILTMLEELYEETKDGDGEVFEKPIFRIDRGVTVDDAPRGRTKTRLTADRTIVKKRPVRRRG